MTITSVDPRTLQRIRGDIQQLAEPIHIAVRGRILTQHPLLDQLRAATQPPTSRSGTSRCAPTSRPPTNLNAIDALGDIYNGIHQWHARLHLTTAPAVRYGCDHTTCQALLRRQVRTIGPPCPTAKRITVDAHKHTLTQLATTAATLAPAVADWLAIEVHDWWSIAATTTGWRTTDLIKLR